MRKVSIREAQRNLSRLVRAAEAGENVVLMRDGQPVVAMVRIRKGHGIELGVLRGKLPEKLIEDIAKPMSSRDLERLFGGGLEP